jgi:hypothetical protein
LEDLAGGRDFFETRFARATKAGRRYLAAMAELGDGPYASGDVSERGEWRAGDLRRAGPPDPDREGPHLQPAIANGPQLVVLRGRRRVGKSFLLVHATRPTRSVFFQADEQDERSHLDLLAREIAPLLTPRVPLRFESWDEALATIGELGREAPLAIVLDEFQWLMAAQPSLESIVQRRRPHANERDLERDPDLHAQPRQDA